MFDFEKNKIVLSLAILGIATLAVFNPMAVFALLGAIIFIILTFRAPVFGIVAVLLAAATGEFGRIELSGISFLTVDIIAPSVLAIWFFGKMIRREKIFFDGITAGLISFWAVGIFSLIFASLNLEMAELKIAILHFLRFVGISGMLLVARDCRKTEAEKISWWLLGVGSLLAVAGFVLMKIFPDFTEVGLTDLGWDPHIGRLTSTFLDPNFAGGLFAFLVALVGGRFLRERKLKVQIVLLAVAGVLGIALLLTFSRSGLLALGVSGLVLGILGDRRVLLAMFVIGFLGVSASPRLAERVGEFAQSVKSIGGESQQVLDPTAQLRVDSWREGLRIWKENPILGTGFGAYRFHQTFEGEESHAATGSDSSLLNIGATTGIVGLSIFVIFLGNIVAASWRKKHWGFIAALGGILAHSVFVNSFFFAPLAVFIFIAAGIATRQKK